MADVVDVSVPLAPLFEQAVKGRHLDQISLLLQGRADPNVTDKLGVSPLHVATFEGASEAVKLLIDNKANVQLKDRHGQTPIFFAPSRNICAQLVSAGADVNVINSKGQSAIHLSAYAGLNDVVKYLASQCRPGLVNHQDKHGRTAAYCATRSKLKSTIRILSECGANLTIRPFPQTKSRSGAVEKRPLVSQTVVPLKKESPVTFKEYYKSHFRGAHVVEGVTCRYFTNTPVPVLPFSTLPSALLPQSKEDKLPKDSTSSIGGEELQNLALKVRETLVSASASGELATALSEVGGTFDSSSRSPSHVLSPGPHFAALSSEHFESLEDHTDVTTERIIEAVAVSSAATIVAVTEAVVELSQDSQTPARFEKSSATEAARGEVAEALKHAAVDGSLESILGSIAGKSTADTRTVMPQTRIEKLRLKGAEDLRRASACGALELSVRKLDTPRSSAAPLPPQQSEAIRIESEDAVAKGVAVADPIIIEENERLKADNALKTQDIEEVEAQKKKQTEEEAAIANVRDEAQKDDAAAKRKKEEDDEVARVRDEELLKKKAEEDKRQKAMEAEAAQKAKAEEAAAQKRKAEEDAEVARVRDEELLKKKAEEDKRQKAMETEAAQKAKAEEAAAQKRKKEEDDEVARLRHEELLKKKAEEAARQKEQAMEAIQKAKAEVKRKANQDAWQKHIAQAYAEELARKKKAREEAIKKAAEEERKRKHAEDAVVQKKRREEEGIRRRQERAEEVAREKAEVARKKAALKTTVMAAVAMGMRSTTHNTTEDTEAAQKAEAEARTKVEESSPPPMPRGAEKEDIANDDIQGKASAPNALDDARLKADEFSKKQAEEEAARVKAEVAKKVAEEEAAEKAEAEARLKADDFAKKQAEEEAARGKAEGAKKMADEEAEAAKKAEAEARLKADELAKKQAEEEAARVKAEVAKRMADEEAEAAKKAEAEARKKAEESSPPPPMPRGGEKEDIRNDEIQGKASAPSALDESIALVKASEETTAEGHAVSSEQPLARNLGRNVTEAFGKSSSKMGEQVALSRATSHHVGPITLRQKVPQPRTRPLPVPSEVPIPKREEQGCTYWQVTLTKNDALERFGFAYANRKDLNVDGCERNALRPLEVLIVRSLMEDGLMCDWNIEHPDAAVLPGDRIVEVNGKYTVYEMKQELRSKSISMQFCRFPAWFDVELTKTPEIAKFGFRFEKPSASNPFAESIHVLRITEVGAGGALDAWNKEKFIAGKPHLVVTAGMCIEAANDIEGDTGALAEQLRTSTTLHLRVRRRVGDFKVPTLTNTKIENTAALEDSKIENISAIEETNSAEEAKSQAKDNIG